MPSWDTPAPPSFKTPPPPTWDTPAPPSFETPPMPTWDTPAPPPPSDPPSAQAFQTPPAPGAPSADDGRGKVLTWYLAACAALLAVLVLAVIYGVFINDSGETLAVDRVTTPRRPAKRQRPKRRPQKSAPRRSRRKPPPSRPPRPPAAWPPTARSSSPSTAWRSARRSSPRMHRSRRTLRANTSSCT